jgi:hypothetical protein
LSKKKPFRQNFFSSVFFLVDYFYIFIFSFFGGPPPITRRYFSWPLARNVAPAARDG